MSDDVFENALVAAQEPSASPTRLDLLRKLSELVFYGRASEPSSYLSALWEEGTIDEIKAEIAKHTFAPLYHNDPGDEDEKFKKAFRDIATAIKPVSEVKRDLGLDEFDKAKATSKPEDDKVRAFAEPVVLKSYKLPLPQIDETIARSLGWVSPEDYNRRVTELLNANNDLVERRRIAEQRQRDAEALIRSLRAFLTDPMRDTLLAEIDRLVSGT